MDTKCILCKGSNIHIIQKVLKQDLCTLYRRSFGVEVDSMITSDLLYQHCQDCDLRFFVCEDGHIPTGDDRFYSTLNQFEWYYFAEKSEYAYVKDFISPESKVLEVGCGKAAFVKFLPKEAQKSYVGLEFNTQAKEMAARDGICIENISIEAYAKSHPKSFDVACSFQVLEHVSDPYSFLDSQIQCLKEGYLTGGGHNEKPLLIVALPSEQSFIQYCVNGILNMPPHHISRFSDTTLHKIAQIFDLELLNIHHERVQPEHFDYYKSIMWAKLFLPTPLIDMGILRKCINKLGLLGKHFIQIPESAYGQAVVAVYTLKSSTSQ